MRSWVYSMRDNAAVPRKPADFPLQGCSPVTRATRTPRTFGICASFKDRFLSPRAKPLRYDSQLVTSLNGDALESHRVRDAVV
jgi:hypothetical protein